MRIVARIRLFGAGQHAEQRRLARAVRPDDADDRAGRELERQVVDQQALAEGLAQVRDLDHEVAEPRTRRDVDLVGLVPRLEFHGGQLVELAQARLALRLARLGVGAHPFELARERAPQALLLLLLLREPLLLLLEPGGVVALPGNAVPAVELEDPAGHVVEEVAVVRDADDRARVLLEVFLEPGDGLRVEVVGRLVEQQHVGLRQQQPAERDAAALAARELRRPWLPRAAGAARRPRCRAGARGCGRRRSRGRPRAAPVPRRACRSPRRARCRARRPARGARARP